MHDLIGSKILGPVFHSDVLIEELYFDFLRNILEDFLDNHNLADRQVRFQQDGASPHNTRNERSFSRSRGPNLWPPRSPDICPMDFYFWGFWMDEVYKSRYDNIKLEIL